MAKQFSWDKVIDHLTSRGVKDSSVNSQLSIMRRVLKGVYEDKAPTLAQVKKSIPDVLEWIKGEQNLPNYSQRKNAMIAMYQFYKALNVPTKRMEDPFKEIVELSQAERLNGQSKKNKEKFDLVSFKQIREKVELEDNPENRLLASIYSGDMPILRGEEWRGIKVITTKKINNKSALPNNYIHLHNKTLHIKDAKSLGGQQVKVVDIPDSIVSEIKKYLASQGGDVLLPNMASSVMTKRLNKMFGYSIQALRKRYVSEKIKEGISPAERIKLARLMGHNLMTQATTYDQKIDD